MYKTRTRTVITLAEGGFEAREVLKRCDRDALCPVVVSDELRHLVPLCQRYGYDLIVHVGLARYLDNRRRQQIRAELSDDHGIDLSEATISNLCDRFLLGLERLHLHRAPELRAAMEGGYSLHPDATCEHGRGGLLVILDGWRRWVLAAKRIPTEHHTHLQPLVEQVVALFGDPTAIMRDLGDGMAAAVEPLRRRGVPDFVCHYHFLAAAGTKLLEQPYTLLRETLHRLGLRSALRSLLRELGRYRGNDRNSGDEGAVSDDQVREDLLALVLWMLEGEGHKDAPFPFGVPHLDFVRRCERAEEHAKLWVPSPRTCAEQRVLRRLHSLLKPITKDRDILRATQGLDEGWLPFCELRDVLRLTAAEMPGGDARCEQAPPASLELVRYSQIEGNLLRYKKKLEERVAAEGKRSAHAVVLRYLQRYGDRLFGHPARHDDQGHILDVVARTNILLERWFRDEKNGLRQRLGRAHLARDLQQQPAQAALASNLRHPDYVRVVCGSLDNLPRAFAELEGVTVPGTTPLVRDHRDHRLHRRIEQLIKEHPMTKTQARIDLNADRASASPSQTSPSPDELQGITEEQIRNRCATVFAPPRDPRLPPPGEVMTRTWEGVEHQVLVLERGFEYQKQVYTSLSPIARLITKGRVNSGERFFGLKRRSVPIQPEVPGRYRLGALSKQFTTIMAEAGYAAATIRVYLGHVQRFADHHRRSPKEMGEQELVHYLLHLVDHLDVSRPTYRAACNALGFLYRSVLNRPRQVARIPGQPELLRQLADDLGLNPAAVINPPSVPNEGARSAMPTVS
ncbi:MAG: DUF2924 domain-containing protein [Actinobacteria bacterium]|nr:DUF2924 domain-containing protein [Actinomycetota bacterium]